MTLTARTLLSMFLLILGGGTVDAASVTLQWDSNREQDLAGYLVSYGTQSGQLTTTEDAGNHTFYQITNLETGRTYFFAVRAYNRAGHVSLPSTEVSATVGTPSLSLPNFMTNLSPPQPLGSTIIFAAGASGATPPYQYRWSIWDGSTWAVASEWSGDNTLTWQPSAAGPSYTVKVAARSADAANLPNYPTAERTMSFAITAAGAAVVNVVSDREAPQFNGTTVVFTATATGAALMYEFQWSVFDGTSWKVLQEWSANSRLSWTPAAPNPNYQVLVRARAGRNLAAAGSIAVPFPIR